MPGVTPVEIAPGCRTLYNFSWSAKREVVEEATATFRATELTSLRASKALRVLLSLPLRSDVNGDDAVHRSLDEGVLEAIADG